MRGDPGIYILLVTLAVGGGIAYYLNTLPGEFSSMGGMATPRPQMTRREPPPTPAPRPVAAVDTRGLWQLQDRYLEALLQNPLDEQARADLVRVRRDLAGGDPALLRRQAAAYQNAIARGGETEEHYTAVAMRYLAEASLLAAEALEGEAGRPGTRPPAPRATAMVLAGGPVAAATPQPAAHPTRRTRRGTQERAPAPSPRRQRLVPPATPPATSLPARASPIPQATPPAPLDVNEPFVLIQVGPLFDAGRASEIAAELTLGGYAARVSRQGGTAYIITLGPYRRSAADRIVPVLKARFGSAAPVTVVPSP